MTKAISIAFVLASLAPLLGGDEPRDKFRTELVRRGDLTVTVQAAGTIEPEEVVDVTAKVSGELIRFGTDPQDRNKTVDYGTRADEGTVLAQIDPALYEVKVQQAREELQKRRASLELLETRLRFAERELKHAQQMQAAQRKAPEEVEELQSRCEIVRSELNVAKADVRLGQAILQEAETKLSYTKITSPIKGVVVDRRVNVGQAVGPTPGSPSLFLLAKLNRLQVWASVPEADIGGIHAGQPVRFSVAAYPNSVFTGKVAQVRLNATLTNNVATYTVVVEVDNAAGKLLPYLTAKVQIETAVRKNVLLVPNAALKWRPRSVDVAADSEPGRPGTVWVEERGTVRPVKLRLGVIDGAWTEVLAGDLTEGRAVVTGKKY
jgi:HlyD family secretion protein